MKSNPSTLSLSDFQIGDTVFYNESVCTIIDLVSRYEGGPDVLILADEDGYQFIVPVSEFHF